MLLVGENPCQNYLTKLFPRSRAKAPLALITFRCILIEQKAYKMGKNIMLQWPDQKSTTIEARIPLQYIYYNIFFPFKFFLFQTNIILFYKVFTKVNRIIYDRKFWYFANHWFLFECGITCNL